MNRAIARFCIVSWQGMGLIFPVQYTVPAIEVFSDRHLPILGGIGGPKSGCIGCLCTAAAAGGMH
jgi:hypothetical protein